jgi:hypothetical protein
VLRFLSGEELFTAAEFFESQPLPRGRRIAIVSNSAGVATLARDASATQQLLAGDASRVLGIHAGPDDYTAAVRALLDDERIDAVMAYYVELSGGRPRAVLQAISEAAKAEHKPVVASVVRADGHLPDPSPGCVPNFLFPSPVRRCSRAQPNAATGSHVRWGSGRGTTTSTRRRPALACQLGWSGSPAGMGIRATDGCLPLRPRRCSPRTASRS